MLPVMPRFIGGGCVGALRAESGIFEGQGAAICKREFFRRPIRALVERVWLGVGWRLFLVEPVQVWFVVGLEIRFLREVPEGAVGGGERRMVPKLRRRLWAAYQAPLWTG